MASQRTYECFVWKRQGVDGVQVYLDGKDPEGRTKYLNEEMMIHNHQGSGAAAAAQQPITSEQVSKEEIVPLLRIINAKLNTLLSETGSETEKHHEETETDGFLIEL